MAVNVNVVYFLSNNLGNRQCYIKIFCVSLHFFKTKEKSYSMEYIKSKEHWLMHKTIQTETFYIEVLNKDKKLRISNQLLLKYKKS